MNKFYNLKLASGSFAVELFTRTGLSANYSLALPNTSPTDNDVLRWNATASAFEWVDSSAFGAGTVTSVGLSAPFQFSVSGSPVTGAGTLALSWANQSGNVILASPSNGSSGAPTFRTLVNADIPTGIDAGKISGVLSKANIPSGTNATSFQLNGNSGVTLTDNGGGSAYLYDQTGAALADLYVKNLFVSGNIDQTTTTTVNLGDSVLNLNSNFTSGTPTANAGLSVSRGSETASQFLWVESSDDWQAGISSNLKAVTRRHQVGIVNADLASGVYTLNHNLGKYPTVTVLDNTLISIGLDVSHVNVNSCLIDFTRVGSLTGTWQVIAQG